MSVWYSTARPFCLVLSLGLLVVTSRVLAQSEARPAPGSAVVPSQDDEPKGKEGDLKEKEFKKSGFVRVWNYAYLPAGEKIALLLVAAGKPLPPPDERKWIARGSASPEVRSFIEVPSGKYALQVLRDKSSPGSPDSALNEGSLAPITLAEKLIEIADDTYQTLLLTKAESGLSLDILADSQIDRSQPKLRIFKLNSDTRPTLSFLEKGQRLTFVKQLSESRSDFGLKNTSAILTLEVANEVRPGYVARQNIEVGGQAVKSYSLLIAPDRYGRSSAMATADAPISAPVFSEGEKLPPSTP